MEIGSTYQYRDSDNVIFVYDIKPFTESGQAPSVYEKETDLDFAVGVVISDNKDIRKIPRKFWNNWTKIS